MSGQLTAAAAQVQPLVAVLCRTPLVFEALVPAFGDLAVLHRFSLGDGGAASLLAWLQPDAVVVDTEQAAADAAAYAAETGATLVYVSVEVPKLRLYRDGGWIEPAGAAPVPETVRNIVLGDALRRRSLA